MRSQYSLRLCLRCRLSFKSGRYCSTCSMPAFSSFVARMQLTVDTFHSSPRTTTQSEAPSVMTTTPGPSRHFLFNLLRRTKTQSPRWNSFFVTRCCAALAFCSFLTVSVSLYARNASTRMSCERWNEDFASTARAVGSTKSSLHRLRGSRWLAPKTLWFGVKSDRS